MSSEDLESLRKKIDEIDTKLMQLMNERAKVSKDIGLVKSQTQASVFQPDREKKVLDHIRSLASDISPISAQEIWKEVMAACRQVQGERNRVAYFGPEGTFTQQAALAFFPKGSTEFIPIERKHEIFQQVEGDYVNFGILPVENSLNGSVSETLDLLIERNLLIYGEIEIRIKHNLIGLPNTPLSQIKTVYSHPQALAQASVWLKKNIPGADLFEFVSTAKAVQKVKEANDPSIAAIGTELAAELYSLSILAKGIEDNTSNYTRFVIVSKNKPNPTDKDKTSIVFVTKHIPGALFNVLKYFADANINLAKIESRPRKIGKDSLWEYIFILDFDEHQDRAKEVLDKVREQSIWLKVLGSYPQRPRKVN